MASKRITHGQIIEHFNGVAQDLRQDIYGLKFTVEKKMDGVETQSERAWKAIEKNAEQIEKNALAIEQLNTAFFRLCERRVDTDVRVEKLEKDMHKVKKVTGVQ